METNLCRSGGGGAEDQDAGVAEEQEGVTFSLLVHQRPTHMGCDARNCFYSFGELFRPSTKGSGSLADSMARLFGSGSPVLHTPLLAQAPVPSVTFIHPFILFP